MQLTDQGAQYNFSIVSGVILSTDQRSDTHIEGGGSATIVNGTGSGTSWVSSTVTVSRDIWIRDANGTEHNVRINKDISFRAGQYISVVYVRSDALQDPQADYLYSIINHSQDRYYTLLSNPRIYRPRSRLYETLKTIDLASIFLSPLFPISQMAHFSMAYFLPVVLVAIILTPIMIVASMVRGVRANKHMPRVEKLHQQVLTAANELARGPMAAAKIA